MLVHQQERRNAMSSTQLARCGIKSETWHPDSPCLLNFRVLAKSGVSPLVNWLIGMPKLLGSGLPCHLANSGFGSKRSTWLGPPTMNMKMIDLALASKCGLLAPSGLAATLPLSGAPPPSRDRKSVV